MMAKARASKGLMVEPTTRPTLSADDRRAWLHAAAVGFVCSTQANKTIYSWLLDKLWPEGHGIPGPVVTKAELRAHVENENRPRLPVDLSEILSMHHGISAALLGVLILLPATPASAQSRNDFAYWDTSGNGDLTCAEAEDRDEGLRLPAYRDNRDGTGIIYEWLERSRSSDGNNDGVACDSASNPNGYIPNAQVEPPVEPQACSADAETWRGLQVCDERPQGGYDRDAFGTGYSNLEDDIIAALPPTMKATGQVYTPYSCLAFDITADGTAATDIEHIVALAETHDSGIADERRRDIASDLDNLTIADPTVNRSEKSDRDAADWMPARHGAWFAERVIQVKLEYGLSVDPAERDALEALLADGDAQLNCVDGTPVPALLLIGQLLLGVSLLGGGARQLYRWTSG